MAKSLLNGVNEVLKRVGVLSGTTGELTTLTDSSKQNYIDVAVQVLNELVEEIYESSGLPKPNEQAESTIALVTGTRSYALAADLVQMRWPLIDKTNNQTIWLFPGGYNEILLYDPEQDDTGMPYYGAISPVNGELYLDRAPAASENGNIYTYQYDKDVSLSLAADTFPFRDVVFRAMIPAAAQLWNRDQKRDFDGAIFRVSLGRALRYLSQKQRPRSWSRF